MSSHPKIYYKVWLTVAEIQENQMTRSVFKKFALLKVHISEKVTD